MEKRNSRNLDSSGMEIPDHAFELLARCLLPKIQEYYESPEGKRVLEDIRAEQAQHISKAG